MPLLVIPQMQVDMEQKKIDILGVYELEHELVQLGYDVDIVKDLINRIVNKYEMQEYGITVSTDISSNVLTQKIAECFQQLLDRLKIQIEASEYDHMQDGILETMLDMIIRPALHTHNGNIKICYTTDNIVGFELTGACDGCPMALVTLTSHISRVFMQYFPLILVLHVVK